MPIFSSQLSNFILFDRQVVNTNKVIEKRLPQIQKENILLIFFPIYLNSINMVSKYIFEIRKTLTEKIYIQRQISLRARKVKHYYLLIEYILSINYFEKIT